MPDTDRPEYLRLYHDAVSALPLPGQRMTVVAYEKVRDLLWADVKAREPKDGEASGEKAAAKTDDDGPSLQRGGSHCADLSRSWSKTIYNPDTIGFGFGRRSNW